MTWQRIGRSGLIKSIQRGSITLTSATVSATAAITAVNPALAEIFNLGSSSGYDITGRIELLDSTTVAAHPAPAPASSQTVTIGFQVTEYNG